MMLRLLLFIGLGAGLMAIGLGAAVIIEHLDGWYLLMFGVPFLFAVKFGLPMALAWYDQRNPFPH
jgi:hypothetical protein